MRRANERKAVKDARRMPARASSLAVGAGVALGATIVVAPPAEAVSLEVTTLADSGPGSLRAAIEAARASDGSDVVTFAPSVTGTIELTSGGLFAKTGITISGPGSELLTVDAGGESRVFSFSEGSGYYSYDGAPVVVSGLTVTGGFASENGQSGGGGISVYDADLTLDDVVVTGNSAERGGGGVKVHDGGDVVVTGSVISDNTAGAYGGGIYVDTARSFTMTRSVVSGNDSGTGGGGGITLYHLYSGGARIADSLVADNSTSGDGGGIHLFTGAYEPVIEFPTVVENTTIAENRAGGTGGGVAIGDQASTAGVATTFVSTTIASNSAAVAGGITAGAGVTALRNTVIADNSGRDLRRVGSGEAFLLDHSLVENPGSASVSQQPSGRSIIGVDPRLGELGDNGGPLPTIAPTASSPVIDQGTSKGILSDARAMVRPVDRVAGATPGDGADMGAVELQPGESPAPHPHPQPDPDPDTGTLVTNTHDHGGGSLREAVANAADHAGADTITFAPSVSGTVELVSGPIRIQDAGPVTIAGPGAAKISVDAGGASRVLEIIGANHYYTGEPLSSTVVSGLTLTGGRAETSDGLYAQPGGAVYAGGGQVTLNDVVVSHSSGSSGGGVAFLAVDATLTHSRISENEASGPGGGIFVTANADVNVSGTTVDGNRAGGDGGGIAAFKASDLVVATSTVSDNTSATYGGGIDVSRSDRMELDRSRITGNSSVRGGGGVHVARMAETSTTDPVPVWIARSEVSGNETEGYGGGIGLFEGFYDGDFSPLWFSTSIDSSTIAGNHADGAGGGVFLSQGFYAEDPAAHTVTGSTISGNSAPVGGGIAAQDGIKRLRSTIVSDNSNGDLRLVGATQGFSLDHSLVEDAGTTPVTHATPGSSILGQDPRLGPLQANGGPTRTMAPAGSSPVIDQGKAFGLAADQRGLARVVDQRGRSDRADGADIGAVELAAVSPPTPKPTPLPALPKPKLSGTPKAGQKLTAIFRLPASAAGAKVAYSWTYTAARKGGKKPKPQVVGRAAALKLKKSWKGGILVLVVTVSKPGVAAKSVSVTAKIR